MWDCKPTCDKFAHAEDCELIAETNRRFERMTNNPIEEWLSNRETAIENDYFEPERISELVALVRVYREVNQFIFQHYEHPQHDHNWAYAVMENARDSEEKAKEIIQK